MKAYIIYIATLLAALAQPAISQTSPQTKAAPDAPVMPYVVTVKEPTSGETAKKLIVQSEYPTSGNIIYKDGGAKNGGVAYYTKGVKFNIAPLPQGYFPEEGFPKVYDTNTPNIKIPLVFVNGAYTFTMPAKPVTIEVEYFKPDDLDLSTLTGDATLAYDKDEGRWTYKVGAGTLTPFSGTIKGKGTCSLEINATDLNATNTLLVKDGTELTGNINVNTNLELQVDKGGTATVRGDITSTKDFKTVTDSGRLYVYGQVTAKGNADIFGMMQWTWTTAPANNQVITIYTPLEETLTSFKANGTLKHFATNFPQDAAAKVKIGDKWQEGKDSGNKVVSTFKMDIFFLTSFTDMKDSEQTPAKDTDGITITGDNTYKPGTDGNGSDIIFDGTVTGGASTIKIDANATITLHQVEKKTDKPVAIEVSEDKKTTIALKGKNELNTVNVGIYASLTLASIGEASLNEAPEITNNGTFTDETGIITKVKDIIEIPTTGNPEDKKGTVGTTITLTASASVSDDATKITYTWQTRSKDTDPWTTYAPATTQSAQIATKAEPVGVETSSITVPTDKVSTSLYRCQIKVEQTATDGSEEYLIVTTLSTKSCTVTVTPKSDGGGGDPTPPPVAPTHYTVTLPALVGFTTDPAAGTHTVEEWTNFSFLLKRVNGYIGSDPTVTTSRGETLSPRQSDGKYVISGVDRNITIYFTSIPTANEAIEAESLRIWNTAGGLNIHTPQAATTTIYTLSGHCIKQFDAPAGDSRIELPEGLYIVVAGNRQQKVIVR